MTEKKPRGRQIHIEMPADDYDAFRALAKEQERTLQGLARKLIRDELERHARASEWNIDIDEAEAAKYGSDLASLMAHLAASIPSGGPDASQLYSRIADELGYTREEFLRRRGESNKEQLR